jgi:predicted dehydrogenase
VIRQPIGVAVVGFGWMGRVHTHAYARVLHHFPDLAVRPELVAVADPEGDRLDEACDQYGFARGVPSWQDLLDDKGVQAVSITVPNFLHQQVGVAMARAGKHIWIEKPVGIGVADAQAVATEVARAGVQATVGFNYRNAPAVAQARVLVEQGQIGTPTHARFRLLSDYAAHPQGALSWRFERRRGGSGVLGDLVSHGIDLARYLLGEVDSLVADTAVFIVERPQPGDTGSHYDLGGGDLGEVENEDYLSCLLRFAGGARATLEASRVSVGEQCNYGFEIHGTKGALYWDFRRMGELGVSVGQNYQNQMVTTVFVGPGHGEYLAFQPGAGIALGFDDLKVVEAARFLQSIADGKPHGATIDDAVRSAVALDAMSASARTGAWTMVPR